jgi:hypothetical protein
MLKYCIEPDWLSGNSGKRWLLGVRTSVPKSGAHGILAAATDQNPENVILWV